MVRVKITALLIILSAVPLLVIVIGGAVAAAVMVLTGNVDAIKSEFLSGYVIVSAWAALGLASAYMLVTYQRLGIVTAQAYLLFCMIGSLYEAFFPSFTFNPALVDGGLPMLSKHIYLACCISGALLFTSFLGYLSPRQFRANYAAIAKGQAAFWKGILAR